MGKMKYLCPWKIEYHSKRYNKDVYVPEKYPSDGATGAIDIYSRSWWVHDKLCNTGTWEDGTPCTNWQASTVLCDILRSESRWLRAIYWWPMTFLFGGGKCRKNKKKDLVKTAILIQFVFLFFGCSWVDKLPNCEFDEFSFIQDYPPFWNLRIEAENGIIEEGSMLCIERVEYHRTDNVTSSHMVLTNYCRELREK